VPLVVQDVLVATFRRKNAFSKISPVR